MATLDDQNIGHKGQGHSSRSLIFSIRNALAIDKHIYEIKNAI